MALVSEWKQKKSFGKGSGFDIVPTKGPPGFSIAVTDYSFRGNPPCKIP